MKHNNRRFFNNNCEFFEHMSQKEIQQLCFSEMTFTNLAGFLFLRKANVANNILKISRQQLIDSMKNALTLSQN